jgi:hypothetical protein
MQGVNHLSVWVAGIAQFALGAAWYTAFSQQWLAGIGRTEEQLRAAQGSIPLLYVIAFAAALIVAYALAQIIPRLGKRSAASGAKSGLRLALVFIAPTLAMNCGFEAPPASLWLLNAGYMTVGMAVMGAIIGAWKQKFNI